VKRATLNYWVDLGIGISFAASAASGVVFLRPVASDTILGLPLLAWSQVHTWASLVMIAGVAAHLLLHRTWIARMTEQELLKRGASAGQGAPVSAGRRRLLQGAGIVALAAAGRAVFGRIFGREGQTAAADAPVDAPLAAAAPAAFGAAAPATSAPGASVAAAAPTGTAMAGSTVAATPSTAPAAVSATATPASPAGSVACPRGVRNDPYPGRCRLYRDRDGDGYCDLSAPSA